MARNQSTRDKNIRAVAYLRMSDRKQDQSIPAQIAEIEKYAAERGIQILRWYRDEGISGAETQKRVGFQQLILDAQASKSFDVILVWDQDRFSRFDPMEANYYWFILRQAGVRIVSIAQGELDFSDLGGWLTASVVQHGKAQYLRDLSRNVLRGKLAKARRGKWQHSRAPYGYAVQGDGDLVCDDVAAAIVRRIFQIYAETDSSFWDVAHILNSEGVPSPAGGKWKSTSVGIILRRECYVTGKMFQLRHAKGKFHGVIDGNIIPAEERGRDRGQGIPLDCPPIVSPELWLRTREHLGKRRRSTTPGRRHKHTVLVGLIHCANCGARMYAGDRGRGKAARPGDRNYWCSTYHHYGVHACTRNQVHEQAILDYLIPKLKEFLLTQANRKRLEDSLRRQAKGKQTPPAELAALKRQLTKLDAELTEASRELKRVPDDLYDLAIADVRRLKNEREMLAARIKEQGSQSGQVDTDAVIQAALDRVSQLREVLDASDRRQLRHALGEMVDRIDLWFEPIRGKKIVRSALTRGVIRLKQVSQLIGRATARY